MKNEMPHLEKFLQFYNDNTMIEPNMSVEENSELMSFMMNDIVMSTQFHNEMMGERVEPDKFGCYSIFCHSFFHSIEDMYDDFPYIAHELLGNCTKEELDKYTEIAYSPITQFDDDLFTYLSGEVVSIIIAGLSQQNDYICKLLVNMYKVFFKKEYKYLKRFGKINASEVISISEDAESGNNLHSVARILCMCEAMHIQIMPNCDGLYLMLNKMSDKIDSAYERKNDFPDIEDGVILEGIRWIDEIEREIEKKSVKHTGRSFIEQMKERDIMYVKEYKPWQRAKTIAEYACSSTGVCKDYIEKCSGPYIDESMELAQMRAVVQTLFPKDDISFEELQSLAVMYSCIKTLISSILQSADFVDQMLGYEIYAPDSQEDRLFTDSMFPERKVDKVVKEQKIIVKEKSTEQRYKEDDLLDEIKQLREKLHSMEQKTAKLRYVNSTKQNAAKDYETLKEEFDAQKEELIALRECVYKMTDQEDIDLDDNDVDRMKEVLADKKIVIIGGHSNWVSKLRNLFSDWVFLSPKTSGAIDNNVVSNADYVYFFTDYIKHSTYYRFINILREEKKPFGYIHSINIENNIRQIYNDLDD